MQLVGGSFAKPDFLNTPKLNLSPQQTNENIKVDGLFDKNEDAEEEISSENDEDF